MSYADHLPEPTRLRATSLGDQGLAWINSLEETVETLAGQWQLEIGNVRAGGSASLVLDTRWGDKEAILKIGLPDSADLVKEAAVFQAAAGRGYAELYELDESRNAMLLERLGSPLEVFDYTVDEQIAIICATLKEAWQASPAGVPLMTGAEKCDWLINFISDQWHKHDHGCAPATLDTTLGFAKERKAAFDPGGCVLCHGDAHELNTLKAGEGFKFVDPDPLVAEPACDLSVPMRGWNEVLLEGNAGHLAQERCGLLSSLTGVPEKAIWQWGYVERVSTGLVLLQIGMVDEGAVYLEAAEALSGVRY